MLLGVWPVKLGVGGDDADIGLDFGEHLLVVVVESLDAETFAEGLEFFAAPVDAGAGSPISKDE